MIAMPSSLFFFKRMSPMMYWKKWSSRGKRGSWFSPSLFIQLFPQLFPFAFHHFFIFSPSNSLNHQFLSVTSTSTEDSGTHETHAVSHTTKVAAYLDDYQFLQKKIPTENQLIPTRFHCKTSFRILCSSFFRIPPLADCLPNILDYRSFLPLGLA